MTAFYIWLVAACVLFILEVLLSLSFALLCFAVGALASALAALLGAGTAWQIGWFAAVSLACFAFIRPHLIKLLTRRADRQPKTNADALIGRAASVVERIPGGAEKGRVAIDGDVWQAVSADGTPIEQGQTTRVLSIDSIVLTVRKAQ